MNQTIARPVPAPRHRAERAAVMAGFVSRLAHAVLWLCVLAAGDVLVALAVTHEHGLAAGAAVFAIVLGAVMAAFTDWAIREIDRPRPRVTPTVQEIPMGEHPTAAARARIAAAFRVHGRHSRIAVRAPRAAHEPRHAASTAPSTITTERRTDA